MKRAYWLYGLLILALGSCSGEGNANDDTPGQVSSEKTLVELVRVEGVAADGSDAAIVRVIARDAAGRAVPNRGVEARSSNPNDVILPENLRTDKNGVAEIHVTATEVGPRVLSITVHSLSLPQRPTLVFVPGTASYLEFVETPGAGQAGRPLRPAIKVEVKDERGNRVSDFDSEITLHVGTEAQTAAAVDGVATFADVVITEPGESHRLRASAPGLEEALSEPIEVVVGPPAALEFQRHPEDVEAGDRISLSVLVRDPAGNPVVGSNERVRVRLYSNPTGAKLEGTLEVQAVDGIATFDDLVIRKNSAGYQITASARGYQSAESRVFTVGSLRPDADNSEFSVTSMDPEAPDAVAVANGRERLAIQGRIVDSEGNPMPGYPVRLDASGTGHRFHPSEEGEGGTLELRTSGTGSFVAWMSSTTAETKRVTLLVGDLFELEQVVTFLPDAENGEFSELVPSVVSAVADEEDAITFEVVVRDDNTNPIPGATVAISASGTGNTFVGGTTKLTGQDGKAIFELVSSKAETKIVTARVGNVTLTREVRFLPGLPDRDASEIHPDDELVGSRATVASTLGAPFRVIIRDRMGNPVPGATVHFALNDDRANEDGTGGASLSDTVVTADEEGIAETTLSLGVRAGNNVVSWMAWLEGGARNDLVVIGEPDVAEHLVVTDGADQIGTAGTALPTRIAIQATDRFGNPTGPLQLSFAGDGTASPNPATIPAWTPGNMNPTALVTWTLRPTIGPNVLTITAPNPIPQDPDLTTQVAAVGNAGAPRQIVATGATSYTAVVGSTLGEDFVVQVLDANGNVVVGADVTFSSSDATGVLVPAAGTSDDDGLVSTRYTLGTGAGTQTVTVSGDGWTANPAATFTITAEADVADSMTMHAGDGQTGTVATALADALQVRVADEHDNPVSGVEVTFAITANAGPNAELSTTSMTTGANGLATTQLTLGDVPGTYQVTATAVGLDPVVFSAEATVGAPASIAIVAGDEQSGTVNQGIAAPLTVQVEDARGNLLEGVQVAFSGPAGTQLSAASVPTESDGRASVTVTQLPQQAGPVAVVATVGSHTATFALTAVADAPHSLTSVSGGNQTGPAGRELPEPLRVLVLDQFSNPVVGASVEFLSMGADAGSFKTDQNPAGADPAFATTDDTGHAEAWWTLPNSTGTHFAMVDVGTASGVTFRGTAGPAIVVDDLVAVAGDLQYTDSGAIFGNALVVRVLDDEGEPVSGEAVEFDVDPATGEILTADPHTDEDGYATAWVAADEQHVGAVAVSATLPNATSVAPVTFDLTAGNEGVCHTSGSTYFRPDAAQVDEAWTATGVYSAGTAGTADTDGFADVQVRLVEAVAGEAGFGYVVDAVAIRCDVDDGDDGVEITQVELVAGETGVSLLVDGVEQDLADPVPASVVFAEDAATGYLQLHCAAGAGLRVLPAGGHFPVVLVDDGGAALDGGFCADPAVTTDLAPGLFTPAP